MMSMVSVYALALSAVGMGLVYVGIAFLNGFLFPSLLAPVYNLTDNGLLRILMAFPFFFGPANFLVGLSYKFGGAGIGGVGSLLFTVLWMTTMAIIVDQAKVNLWIVGGALLCVLGCFFVLHGLKTGI